MIARGDLYEISHIAENVEELYNFITNELGIDESKQQKLVDEITYQFSNADNSIGMLEAENDDLEDDNYRLEEENDELQAENEELRNKLNEWKKWA